LKVFQPAENKTTQRVSLLLNLLRAKAHSAGFIDPLSRPARFLGLGLSGSKNSTFTEK